MLVTINNNFFFLTFVWTAGWSLNGSRSVPNMENLVFEKPLFYFTFLSLLLRYFQFCSRPHGRHTPFPLASTNALAETMCAFERVERHIGKADSVAETKL